MALPDWLIDRDEVCHVDHRDAAAGVSGDWPVWLPPTIVASLSDVGIRRPWLHQVELAEVVFAGRHATICTSTASGKTLGYLLPIMAATALHPGVVGVPVTSRLHRPRRAHTALYLAPTKALAHDQLRAAASLGPPGWKISTLDGDSDAAERRFARDFASYVLSNPDMLHRSLLPNHAAWAGFLASLRYVVVDEAHRYRGVFGAHVAAVLRRLRRICAQYGSEPVFVLASATSSNAGEAGARLIGEPEIAVVEADWSPRAARDVVLWRPQESLTADAAHLLGRLVDDGKQTVCFVPARNLAERIAVRAHDLAACGDSIVSYRAGYLPTDRRSIEAALQTGAVRGVAATNALELGIDISGMDAVIIAGYPGTLAALWQQAGRAGRGTRDALVIVLAREDPLDAYLFEHPPLIFSAPVETTVIHPDNPRVLGPHLGAAAQEAYLTRDDTRWFGPMMEPVADLLVARGLLRRRSQGWFWTRPERAVDAIDLRAVSGRPLDIVERDSGRVIGQVDAAAADWTVHPGAVYLHQGEQWLVDALEHDQHRALVHAERPGFFTQARSVSDARILREIARRPFGRGEVCVGDIELTGQVIGYLRRDEVTGDIWDTSPLELPQRRFTTRAVWWPLPEQLVDEMNLSTTRLGAAAHAAEHTAIGLLPMLAPCDRWDIGGLSTPLHPDTGTCTIFVHDGLAGGAGFAEAGYRHAEAWAAATLERLRDCPCELGCPACVVSPKCGNLNQLLDKDAARLLLGALLEPTGASLVTQRRREGTRDSQPAGPAAATAATDRGPAASPGRSATPTLTFTTKLR